jgi:serine/threonine protein kinase
MGDVSIEPSAELAAEVPSAESLVIVPDREREFGRYTLLARLASGGMANLYLARYVGPDGFEKLVAIKKIHDHLADDVDFVRMFVDEARLAARITHQNVVQVLELGSVNRAYFIAMEYVEGESLAQLIKRSRVPLAICARIISQAALGLHAAHELKDNAGNLLHVVHRDVSPQNILISYDGAVKVVDFGVAKARSNLATTRVGTIKGKFAYMAPEQLKPERFGNVDRRADIFPLGILLFEATTRRRLFRAESEAATVEKVLHQEVLPPSLYVEDYPDELAQICMRALQRRPEDRFQTAEEMHLALESFLSRAYEPVLPGTISEVMRRVFADQVDYKAGILREALEMAPAPDPSYSVISTMKSASGEVLARRRKVALAAGTVGVALALLGVLVYTLLRPTPPPPVPAHAPAVRQPEPIRVLIRATPPHASVHFDGKEVPNPFEMRAKPEQREVEVEVSAPDHRAQRFAVSLAEGGRWIVALERLQPDGGAAGMASSPPKKRIRPRKHRPRGRKRRRAERKPDPKAKQKKTINTLFTNPYDK